MEGVLPVKIRAGARRPLFDVRELARHRDLLLSLALRDVKVRYKQTVLGVIWVVLQPLLAALVFSFVFGKVARMPSGRGSYLLFAYTGMLAWNLFSNVLSRSSQALVANTHLVTKVYFPRLVLPLSTVGSSLLDFGVALAMLAVLMGVERLVPASSVAATATATVAPTIGPGLLLLPVWVTILVLLAVGSGLIAGALMVSYRDVQHVIPMLLTLGLYISPVAWAVSAVPSRYRLVFELNPLSSFLEAFRWSLLGDGTVAAWPILYTTALAVLVFGAGLWVFRRMERRFADVL